MNERKTEIIVRDYLRGLGFYDNTSIIVEEQQSDIPNVDKLLKNASKKGTGKGYPEFIITSSISTNFIIVIECKADIKKHQSESLNKYSEYAVDGALLYASYLSKEFDVLAIGVSGETCSELRIDHFLYLKNTNKYYKYFGDKILTFNDYYNGYNTSDIKFNQDYNQLLSYSKRLNEELRSKKVKEAQRSLLISGILIALNNKAFKASYKSHKKASQLATSLITTVSDEFTNAGLQDYKIKNLNQAFSFITTHTTLSSDKKFFEETINSIDDNINSFMRTHKYFDTLGQFYIEFLRYANNDKGLGIVLTPPHITELFTELASIDKDSIVFDNCCGTGGFLISAMEKMVKDAKSDSDKILNIKMNQLIGVEYQDDIFTLGVSNMIIHGDGKTNIYQGSCFDVQNAIKSQHKPTVGFLNPPYKSKKDDIEELQFVLNNLDVLEPNSICVAIVPLSCAIATSGNGFELKKQLLQKHTLEAVMSMPEDLFHNSKVSVVTCTLVVRAHKPHPSGEKTWLGYWRNDGFIKTKGQGRIDLYNTWEATKKEWVNSYINKDVTENSLSKLLSADDEWCAEAYMDTDYKQITPTMFLNHTKNYLTFRLLNDLLDFNKEGNSVPVSDNDDIKLLPLNKLFHIKNGLASSQVIVKEVAENENDIRYIRPSQSYSGSIAGYVDSVMIDDKYIYPQNTIYVSTDGQGSHSYSYLSAFNFVPNSNVSVLIPKREMTTQEKLYYSLCITINRFRYSYGRKPKGDRLKLLQVPSFPPKFVYSDVFTEIFDNWKTMIK